MNILNIMLPFIFGEGVPMIPWHRYAEELEKKSKKTKKKFLTVTLKERAKRKTVPSSIRGGTGERSKPIYIEWCKLLQFTSRQYPIGSKQIAYC